MWLLLVILAAALGLRVFNLGQRSLTWDEGHSYRWASMPPGEMIHETTTQDFNPPAYYLSLHYWMWIFGESEWTMRLYSALPSTLAVLLIFLMGRAMFDVRVGLIAAAFMAVSELNVSYAREARSYSQMVLLATLSMYCCHRLLLRGGLAWVIGHVLASAALAYTHPYGIFYIVTHNLIFTALWVFRRGAVKITIPKWIAIETALLALLIPFLIFAFRRAGAVGVGFWIVEPELDRIPVALMTIGGGAIPMGILGLMCVVAMLRGFPGRDARPVAKAPAPTTGFDHLAKMIFLSLWLATPILLPFAMSKVSTPIFSPRYTIAASGALFLLAAVGTAILFRHRLVGAAVLAIVIGHQLTRVGGIYDNPRGEPWREATALLDANAQAGDDLFFYGHFPGVGKDLFDYYTTRADVRSHALPTGFNMIDAAQADALFARIKGRDRVWLISSHQKDSDHLLEARLRRAYRAMTSHSEYERPGIRIQLFDDPRDQVDGALD